MAACPPASAPPAPTPHCPALYQPVCTNPSNPAKMRDLVRAGLALLVLPVCARAFALAPALTNAFIVRARPGGKWI